MAEPCKQLHRRLIHHAKRVPHHAHHLFIPHHGNNHQPHALRAPAIRFYSVLLILVKVFVSGFLFMAYPSTAEFAAITTAEILNHTNASRASSGLPSLSLNSTLNYAAQLKAQNMINENYFAHTSPSGTKPWDFLKQAGYSYSAAGENLAMDFTEAGTVHTAFMNSPSHAENILGEKYTEMGIAVLNGEIDGRTTTVLVEFFGKPYEQPVVEVVPEPAPAPEPQPEPTPTPEPAPAPQPTPEPTPQPVETASEPAIYSASVADQSDKSFVILAGDAFKVWVEFNNDGNTTWQNSGDNFVALNTVNPAGRESAFYHDSWAEPYRPAKLDQDRVVPNEDGRFTFTMKAPKEAGAYEEDFALVVENLVWIDGGMIELPIEVVQREEKETPLTVEVAGQTQEPTVPPQTEPSSDEPASPVSEEPLAPVDLSPETIKQAENAGERSEGFVGALIEFSNRFFEVFLIFIVVALLVNILVKIRVQHPHIILQSMLVIILTTSAILYKPHFLEGITHILTIT